MTSSHSALIFGTTILFSVAIVGTIETNTLKTLFYYFSPSDGNTLALLW